MTGCGATGLNDTSRDPSKCLDLNQPLKYKTHQCEGMANAGNADAQFIMAMVYLNGEGVEINEKIGSEWLHRAVIQQHSVSASTLGTLYRYGNGVEKNLQDSLYWYKKAQEWGSSNDYKNIREVEEEFGMWHTVIDNICESSSLTPAILMELADISGNTHKVSDVVKSNERVVQLRLEIPESKRNTIMYRGWKRCVENKNLQSGNTKYNKYK